MKVIIAGSRPIKDYSIIEEGMCKCPFLNQITEVVCGEATGPDKNGKQWATTNGIPVKSFDPDWSQGNYMGNVRNHVMGDYADALVAAWDGRSKGTKDMIDYMRKLKKPVFVINCFPTLLDRLNS